MASLGCNALLGTDEATSKASKVAREHGDADAQTSADPTVPSGDHDEDGDAGSGADHSSTGGKTTSGPTGPGPLGALPFGYCCNSDDECRSRHCEAVGSGGKMCLDPCETALLCTRKELTFTCVGAKSFEPGWCKPATASFQCLPQLQFTRGTKKSGECCKPTSDGNSGQECEANHCGQWETSEGSGPWICTQHCDATQACPPGLFCLENDLCAPADYPYTCN